MSERKQRNDWLAVVVGAVLALSVTLSSAASLQINLASAYGAENFHTQNLQHFADDLRAATNGQLDFKIHPGGTLLKPTEIFTGVTTGKAQAGEVIMSSLAAENVMFAIDSLPFIVSDYVDAKRLWDASRPSVEKALDAQNLKLLYAVPWPAQNLYSNREIVTVKNFKGLTMRSYSPSTERIAQLIGAKPVTIQAVDLAQAISDGTLDLMITSSPTGVGTKAWSKMTHYYKVNAWIPKNIVFIDKKLFAGLDANNRKKLLDAAAIAEKRGWALSQTSDSDFEKQLVANKVNVSTMDFIIRSYLDRIGETLAREWLKKAGNEELSVLLQYTTNRSIRHAAEQ